MANGNWEKAKKIFADAIKFAPDKRLRFLDEVCADDADTRREIESLLASYDDAESFLDSPAVGEVADIIYQADTLERGKCFGHYEIIEQIGAGGMGEVYLARDKKLDRSVAVKILNEKFAKHETNLIRFVREAKAASALNHPNILVIHEIGAENNAHFIVSEFIKGETLREIFKRKTLKLSEVLDISIQIANALTAAHEAHLIHRDIKPENIMMRPDGYVKILDFGLAKLVEHKSIGFEDATVLQNQTAKGIIMGTVNYMSPEQAKGERVDAATDIFSFGVVLYEMLAGRTPFAGDSLSETFANLINAEPLPLSSFSTNIPDELQRIVAKMLCKKKDKRFQTMRGLLTDLKVLQKRIEFEAELECVSQSDKQAEAETQISEDQIFEETTSIPPNNLTGSLSPVVGREKEISHIKNLLSQNDVRLITLAGIGGTGKTRLAKAVAQEMVQVFPEGVFFIEIAAITNSELVASTIAQSLGIKEAGNKPILETLKDYLRERQMLLILDNFEQVAAAAPIIAELLATAANLKILITSRILLHLSAEREFIVPPLAVPDETSNISLDDISNYEAIRLFVERARNVKPGFALTNENADDVAKICGRLDGLPLAIELAAARIKILSPRTILTKLENRLKLLTGGASDLPVRQQTMRDAIEWSYDLLNEDEKFLFRRLAIFEGGFTFEAAEAVCEMSEPSAAAGVSSVIGKVMQSTINQPAAADGSDSLSIIGVLDLITSLVDKSLLVSKEQPNDEKRFRMLETLRQYALESLEKNNEAEAVRRSHAAYFLAL